jgi:hypothetical protein
VTRGLPASKSLFEGFQSLKTAQNGFTFALNSIKVLGRRAIGLVVAAAKLML